MPKMEHTRKQRAKELLERLERGPSLFPFDRELDQEASRKYRLWAISWILQEVKDLIPELKEQK